VTRLRAGLTAPLVAVRRTAGNPALARVQMAWAAVMVSSWTATVSLAVAAYAVGGSAAVAVSVLARTLPGLVFGPALGALVDRWPRSRVLAGAALISAGAAAGAASVGGALVPLIALVTLTSLATMVFRTAQSAVLPQLVDDPADLTAANVLASSVEAVGVFAGPALAGVLLAVQGPALAFSASAGLFLLAALLAERAQVPRDTRRTGNAAARGSTLDVLRGGDARVVLLLLLAQTVVSGALAVLYAAVAVDLLGTGPSAVGLLTAAFGLGGVLGSVGLFALAGSRRLGRLTALALLLWSVPLLLVPAVPRLGAVLGLLAVVGVGNVLFDVTSVTLLQRAVPPSLMGRAFGAVETVVVAGLAAGAAVAPFLDEALGAGPALALVAAPLAVVALVAVPALRGLDARLLAPVRQVELLRGLAPFALLPPVELEALALRLRRQELAAGAVIVRQGDAGTSYYVVDAGLLDVAVDGRDVGVLGAGEGFGEVALLHGGIRTATVGARTAAVVWELEGAAFLSALRDAGGRALEAAGAVARARLQRAAPGSG
jgi:MFS family permease